MVLTILGLATIIIFTYNIYSTAKDYGRNGAGWASLAFALGIGIQWILPFCLTVILGVYLALTGITGAEALETVYTYAVFLNIGSLIFSIIAMWFILRFVSKMPDEIPPVKPPPPPSF